MGVSDEQKIKENLVYLGFLIKRMAKLAWTVRGTSAEVTFLQDELPLVLLVD